MIDGKAVEGLIGLPVLRDLGGPDRRKTRRNRAAQPSPSRAVSTGRSSISAWRIGGEGAGDQPPGLTSSGGGPGARSSGCRDVASPRSVGATGRETVRPHPEGSSEASCAGSVSGRTPVAANHVPDPSDNRHEQSNPENIPERPHQH